MLSASQKRSEGDRALDPEACLAEVERLVRSPFLSGSEALCKLLQFLAHHSLNSPSEHVKEYEIATEVFGRPPDFDPQSDSGVRVQMGRLRAKLTEYYQTAGADDPIQVEVPKGGYALSFWRRVVESDSESSEKEASEPPGKLVDGVGRRTPVIAISVLACVLVAVFILIFISRRQPAIPDAFKNQSVKAIPDAALRTFWGPFLQGPDAPFVVFSNAQFVGNPIAGMRYYDSSRDSRDQISQHYTGIGEVMGVAELQGLFPQFGQQIQIKSGGLFTLDDARKNNLIFVGSPTENLTLDEIPHSGGFIFKLLQVEHNDWVQGVVDLQPRAGEPSEYLPTPESRPMNIDYAVITLTHGLDRSRWTLILAGASTVGTEAAVDYACDPDTVKNLLHRLNIQPGSGMNPFEALLRVRISNDVPLTVELVKFRKTE
ncbi:MAG TPA: helix-turn-helix domain-containing protein [Terracidiphilus sp.]|jgi:hypothetical protein|nr:helix-turn-helix domain-containing protein [Terracidiphilus sp.]